MASPLGIRSHARERFDPGVPKVTQSQMGKVEGQAWGGNQAEGREEAAAVPVAQYGGAGGCV